MRLRSTVAVVFVTSVAAVAHATVWQRVRPDGTVEFTNVPRGGKSWNAVKDSDLGPPPMRPAPQARPAVKRTTTSSFAPGVVWSREHDDGTMEFTNVTPLGAKWKVLFRTGPGKAAAVRGLSDMVPARDLSPARFARFDDHIRDQQAFFGIPQALIRAVIKSESDFDPRVVSSAGAMGLMQLMPGTARDMGVTDVWDPRQNIMGGARYLQTLAQRFCRTPLASGPGGTSGGFVCSDDELVRVIAGYHAGPGAVLRYGGLPPYETTRSYVTTVILRYQEFGKREAALAALAAAANP